MPNGEQLDRLLAVRATAHRIGAPSLTSVAELEAWIEDRSMALVSGRSAVPSASEAIVGRAIEGSWWGDPEGSLIYGLLTAIESTTPPIADLVLVDGKRTLVSSRLLPIVQALAADAERRRRVIAGLKAPARRVLDLLGDERAIRAEDTSLSAAEFRKARGALESGLLARSTSVHTESGHHASLLEGSGSGSDSGEGAAPAGGEAALRSLLESALWSAVVASRREMEKWFRFVEPDAVRRRAAIDELGARPVDGPGGVWLTLLG
ncbi:MAG TPA: hypothetical protein VKA05_05120 [Acidimicrobiales bacterium]|nr:hypothetical protein [Acidimicrobiales bacterium]